MTTSDGGVGAGAGEGAVVVGSPPRLALRRAGMALAVLSFGLAAASLVMPEVHVAVGAGIAAFLLGIAAAFLGAASVGIVQIAVDPSRAVVRLTTSDGGSVDLPLDTVDDAEAASRLVTGKSASRTAWELTLRKSDGGRLDTQLSRPEAEVRQLADTLSAALAAARKRPAAVASRPEQLETLRARTRLRVETTAPAATTYRSEAGHEAVTVSWSASTPWIQTMLLLGALGGFAGATRAIASRPGETGAMIGVLFAGALCALVLALFAMSLGVRVLVRLDDEALTVERRRFGRPFASHRWALGDVRAIDFSVTAQTPTLSVRASDELPFPDVHPGEAPVGFAAAVIRHARQPNQMPLGSLTLADGLHLDLALSAELARRKGVAPGSV